MRPASTGRSLGGPDDELIWTVLSAVAAVGALLSALLYVGLNVAIGVEDASGYVRLRIPGGHRVAFRASYGATTGVVLALTSAPVTGALLVWLLRRPKTTGLPRSVAEAV